MTTIAWDGERLAADSQVTFGNLIGHCDKVVKLSDGRLLASTGFAEDHFQVMHWLESGGLRGKREDDPKQPVLDRDYNAFLIDADGAWIIQANLIRWPMPGRQWAAGSGRDFAVAAMYLGKTADQAIGIACRFDSGSSLPVSTVSREGE